MSSKKSISERLEEARRRARENTERVRATQKKKIC